MPGNPGLALRFQVAMYVHLLLLGEEFNLQLHKSFGSIFLMLPMKVAKGSIVVRGNPRPPTLSDSPGNIS